MDGWWGQWALWTGLASCCFGFEIFYVCGFLLKREGCGSVNAWSCSVQPSVLLHALLLTKAIILCEKAAFKRRGDPWVLVFSGGVVSIIWDSDLWENRRCRVSPLFFLIFELLTLLILPFWRKPLIHLTISIQSRSCDPCVWSTRSFSMCDCKRGCRE